MIPVTEPLQAIHGTCSLCRNRVWQVLIESNLNGSPARHWLKVDEVYGVGDEDEVLAGFHQHACREVAA